MHGGRRREAASRVQGLNADEAHPNLLDRSGAEMGKGRNARARPPETSGDHLASVGSQSKGVGQAAHGWHARGRGRIRDLGVGGRLSASSRRTAHRRMEATAHRTPTRDHHQQARQQTRGSGRRMPWAAGSRRRGGTGRRAARLCPPRPHESDAGKRLWMGRSKPTTPTRR